MNPTAILNQLRDIGVTVTVKGASLRLTPGSVVPLGLVEELRQHKAEVLALLSDTPRPPLKYPGDGPPGASELEEIEARVYADGVVLLWSTVLQDLIAFYRDEAARQRIPPGFVPYSEEELWRLFRADPEGEPSDNGLRLIHEAKKHGAVVVDQPSKRREDGCT